MYPVEIIATFGINHVQTALELAKKIITFADNEGCHVIVRMNGEEVLMAIQDPQSRPIEDLGLGIRITDALNQEGITTIDDLLGWTEFDLLDIRMIGPVSVTDIMSRLSLWGLKLPDYSFLRS